MKQQADDPLFKAIFGENWIKLPTVFKKHYQNKPFSNDRIEAKGYLDIYCHPLIKIIVKPFYRWMGIAPMVTESQIPVTVKYYSLPHSASFHLQRDFYFKTGAPYHFCSQMVHKKGSELIDVMRFNVGWRLNYIWQDNKVILKHKGYALKLWGYFLPLPITFLLGRINAYEYAIDVNSFGMQAEINHWLFGTLYRYSGQFKILI